MKTFLLALAVNILSPLALGQSIPLLPGQSFPVLGTDLVITCQTVSGTAFDYCDCSWGGTSQGWSVHRHRQIIRYPSSPIYDDLMANGLGSEVACNQRLAE